jgi:hypothetical protein
VTNLNEKKTWGGNRIENLHYDRSVENDLNEYFEVLDELSRMFDDYTAIPTIPSGFDRIG